MLLPVQPGLRYPLQRLLIGRDGRGLGHYQLRLVVQPASALIDSAVRGCRGRVALWRLVCWVLDGSDESRKHFDG